jgi:hypothetical protein
MKWDERIPFILLHKMGFMREFVYGVIQLLIQGMHIKAIETFIAERQLHFCQSKHACKMNCSYSYVLMKKQ